MRGAVIREFEKPSGPYGKGGHQGIDICCPEGTPVYASGDGKVAWTGELPRGRFVSVDHPGGVRTVYLDLREITVARGESVSRGQELGTSGGLRDDSSSRPHLHFGTYMNGTPVNPRLVLDGFDSGGYIRLCPADRGPASNTAERSPPDDAGGLFGRFFSGVKNAGSGLWNGITGALGGFADLLSSAWSGACSLFGRAVRGLDALWDRCLYQALRKAGAWMADAFKWAWSNRFVQAVVAGLAAAVAVVALIVLAVVVLGLSTVVAVIAAIAATVACLGMAVYYACTSGSQFSFAGCFYASFATGAVVAALVLSASSLAGAFSAGWSKVGLWGAVRAAAGNGLFSAIFEGATSYIFTGRISVAGMLVAFGIGALSGVVGKVLRSGIMPRGAMYLFSRTSNGVFARMVSAGRELVVMVRTVSATVRGVVLVVKDALWSLTRKLAYVCFSGSFSAALSTVASAINHRPISISGILASFITGAAMGAVALSFGRKGISGLLEKISVFREGIGKALRPLAAKLSGKLIRKGMKKITETGLEKLLKEEVPIE